VTSSREFTISTKRKIERVDITERVRQAVGSAGFERGAVLVSVPHTTAAVTTGENWDGDVGSDIERALPAWLPEVRFDHSEGNSPAHLLSEVIGAGRMVPVEEGRLVLGRWQGIFLIELDGPRARTVRLDLLAAAT
jgi:secondary thiamine-phosphate synthase enzyme